jgi:protein-disulfide isomerase
MTENRMSLRERFLDALTVAALIGSVVTAMVVVRRELFLKDAAGSSQPKPIAVDGWKKYIDSGRLVGNPQAPLKIVEFADFRCPACRALNGIIKQLDKEFPGKLAISYRYVPLPYHPLAYPAARAAECAAQQGRFAAYHDLLFDRFDSLGTASFNDVATKAGVPNAKAFAQCNSHTDSIPRINSDRALAMDTLHISGTPTVIVNGMMYAFAPPLGELRKLVKGAH